MTGKGEETRDRTQRIFSLGIGALGNFHIPNLLRILECKLPTASEHDNSNRVSFRACP